MSEPKLPANWHGERCGHNYPILKCPYDDCVARELYDCLEVLVSKIRDGSLSADLTGTPVLMMAQATLAKARGD
jgi:hypothetical protein